MKHRSRKIQKLVKLAATEERRFAEATGISQQQLNEQQNRLGELNAHRHNYAANSTQSQGKSAAHWKDYQSFMRRLDEAVLSQQQIIRDCEQNLERHRRQWQIKRQRLESLERVLDRYQTEEHIIEDRQAQRVADDRRPANKQFVSDST